MRKHYLALVRGWPDEAGVIDQDLARDPEQRSTGQPRLPAVTHYGRLRCLEWPFSVDARHATSRYALMEVQPLTGRRHQIRRHFKHIAHPLVGDTTHGKGAHNRAVAEWLERHPKVRRVLWPGLASHEQAELARRQMRNFSGLLSFSVNADSAAMARQLAERLKLVSYAVSLGKTKSLCFYIPTEDILRSSFALADERTYRAWAGAGVFRVSVGIEDADAIIADFDEALK